MTLPTRAAQAFVAKLKELCPDMDGWDEASEEDKQLATACMEAVLAVTQGWQPLDTAPKGYDGKKFNHVLFRGVSKARSFSGTVYVSGWMDSDRNPVHEYSYKLIITGWKPLPDIEDQVQL